MTKMLETVHINIGSNLGNRGANIDAAVAEIRRHIPGCEITAVSSPYSSEPWGFDSKNQFVNVAVALSTSLQPLELLHYLQKVERSIDPSPHRNPDGTYTDRRIDIDIIAFGFRHIESSELTVPHPYALRRDFVMQPLAELLGSMDKAVGLIRGAADRTIESKE